MERQGASQESVHGRLAGHEGAMQHKCWQQ